MGLSAGGTVSIFRNPFKRATSAIPDGFFSANDLLDWLSFKYLVLFCKKISGSSEEFLKKQLTIGQR